MAVSGYCLTGLCSLLPSFLAQTNKLICYLSLWKTEFLNNRKRIYYVLPFKIEFWYHHPSLCVHVLRGQRTTQMSWFSSPSKMWVLGIKLRLPGLEARAFILWATLPASIIFYKTVWSHLFSNKWALWPHHGRCAHCWTQDTDRRILACVWVSFFRFSSEYIVMPQT